MSSDSAFQSLGDDLELEHEEKPAFSSISSKQGKDDQAKSQMKALAEEAKMRLRKGRYQEANRTVCEVHFVYALGTNSGVSRYRNRRSTGESRFSTQPVTSDEVQEASKIQTKEDPDLCAGQF